MLSKSIDQNAALAPLPATREPRDWLRSSISTSVFVLLLLTIVPQAHAASLTIQTAAGGIAIAANTSAFGTMNALAIGANPAGVTSAVLSNGALYYSNVQFKFTGMGAKNGYVTAYVSSPFTHPSALIVYACGLTTCASANYAAMSTSSVAPTVVAPKPGFGNNATTTAGIGIFIPDNDGASAFTGADSVSITFKMLDASNDALLDTQVLLLSNANQKVQTAVQLTLASATGGLAVSPASDYSMNFSTVNGLGIGPAGGLLTTSAAGGYIYHTPYTVTPVFGAFTSSVATVKVYVSTNFAHPTIFVLQDSALAGSGYGAISTSSSTPTQITASAADRTPITRFLGLFVSNANGIPVFATDTATLTYTLTVP
jgi:hypothetical protein